MAPPRGASRLLVLGSNDELVGRGLELALLAFLLLAVVSLGALGRARGIIDLLLPGVNRGFSLLSGGLDDPLRGCLALPRGRALGLLHGGSLKEFSDFISSPTVIEF
jgi:hypothetical protein